MIKKAFVFLLTGSLFLAGCGGGAKDSSTAAGYHTEPMMTAVQETMAAAYDMAETAEEGAWNEDFQADNTAYEEITSSSGINQSASPARKLIRNVSMSVETDAFDNLINQLHSKVTELTGYIEQSDISGSSITYNNVRPDRYASITARVPSDKLDQFIQIVESSGNVTNKSESTQDVTLQYSDLESRKKTLTVEQERIWSLLEKADTLEAVIALEERLSEIRYELESMESRLKLFDNQVEYSTIEISVHEVLPADFTPVAPESVSERIRKGFAKNVENVSEALTDLFIGIIVGIPVWLPLLAALILIAVLIRHILKKKKLSLFQKNEKVIVSFASNHEPPAPPAPPQEP